VLKCTDAQFEPYRKSQESKACNHAHDTQ
jgi:hypothetical protein